MGHGHGHDAAAIRRVRVARTPRRILLIALIVVAVATIVGLMLLWPVAGRLGGPASAPSSSRGTTYPTGEILKLTDCADMRPSAGGGTGGSGGSGGTGGSGGSGGTSGSDGAAGPAAGGASPAPCSIAQVRIESGERAGDKATIMLNGPFARAGLRPGDRLELMVTALPGRSNVAQPGGVDPGISAFGVVRTVPLAVWAGLFALVVIVVGLLRGLLALVGLVFSGAMIVLFMLPALLQAGPAMGIALVGASAILYVVLYLAHGLSMRTSAALAGTLAGVAITAILAQVAVGTTRLSGLDESAGFLAPMVPQVDFQGLLTCAIIIAGLGVLNDVTITQSSAVWELRALAPELSRRQLFGRAMRIGRDHIASTIYTIVFAYVGASLSVVLLLYLYDQPMMNMLGLEDIATEVVRTLCSGIGLVLAVPLTTAIAVALLPPGSAVTGDPVPAALGEDDADTVAWLRTLRTVEVPPFPSADPRP
ncbi:YibE/F-like protein [Microbacterium sp. 8M]|uniref:YibE/F family protein n=1 Tax=Microbacterium sp. 8M TaxID=2653153 RepID=UPI0012F2FC6D|nr:YibE/F family protein [Microbacterium sp. 8M]VXA94298.1 YibE/F-like protein [Microbacterium sp. 8M]